jgi:hypothetical protein
MTNPIIVGGTGGSGTRCLGAIIARSDGYLGWDLNTSRDSLSLTPFLKRHMLEAYKHFEDLPSDMVERWKAEFALALSTHLAKYSAQKIWGWKNPTSMYFLPFLFDVFDEMKFIHLIRDGRDMALSGNSNQYRSINGNNDGDILKKAEFWSATNTRIKEFTSKLSEDNCLLVRFEDLCSDRRPQIERILDFIGSSKSIDSCLPDVQRPASIGRYRSLPRGEIDRLTEAANPGLSEFGYV